MIFGSTMQFRKAVMGYFGNLRDDVAGINNSADVGHVASIRRRGHLTGGEVLFVGDYAQNKEQEIHGVVRQRGGWKDSGGRPGPRPETDGPALERWLTRNRVGGQGNQKLSEVGLKGREGNVNRNSRLRLWRHWRQEGLRLASMGT